MKGLQNEVPCTRKPLTLTAVPLMLVLVYEKLILNRLQAHGSEHFINATTMLYKSSRYMIMWWTTLMMFDTGKSILSSGEISIGFAHSLTT
jgi:hypothetical protein